MKLYKLIILCLVILLINFSVLYVLFFYKPIYQTTNISPSTNYGITWNYDGSQIAYYDREQSRDIINIYNFEEKSKQKIMPPQNIETFSSLGFSDDNNLISFYRNDSNNRKSIDILDVANSQSVINSVFSQKQDLITSDGSRPQPAIIWLNKETVIFENSTPFKRTGIIFLNIKSGKEERYMENSFRPALSNDKEYLAYARKEDENFSVFRLKIATGEEEKVYDNLGYYIDEIVWSPDDSSMAVSYRYQQDINQPSASLQKLKIIKQDGQVIDLSKNMELGKPQWLDNNNLLFVRHEKFGFFISSKSVTGLYAFNLKNNAIALLSQRIRSEQYYLRPNSHEIYYGGGNFLEYINIDRITNPKGINALRKKLGIVI